MLCGQSLSHQSASKQAGRVLVEFHELLKEPNLKKKPNVLKVPRFMRYLGSWRVLALARKPQTSIVQRTLNCPPALVPLTPARCATTAVTPDSSPIPLAEPVYTPPTAGILSVLPKSWVPYAELIRIDKPTGTYYLFFPCLFSTLMAAPMAMPMASPLSVLGTTLLFFSGALIMRGAAVRGSRHLLSFPLQCLYYGIPSLLFVASYPLAKRVTYYPQAVLGLTFSWGAFMGFPALGVDLLANSAALTAAACLYSSNIAWTVLYDMIYAHMDIKDDAKAGIKSIALKHDADTKKVLTGLAAVQIGLLGAAGVAAGAGPAFFVGSCGGALVTLGIMIKRVNLKSVKDCWWWFVNGCWITGGVISMGLGVDYAVRYAADDEDNKAIVH
ncbi:para-hydroxybenzoate-polyprenyltransferase [Verticillium alfalfae VaMs.102]|uniref:Para-hydroxybenzoate-polyprenyltransferase n=1 Tax=Verticillium alfalfae (strain VaMs.102 / ATCC MYA-4576 / FGSC 10136) TaxID=526221 RepID=C9SF99_VERA1|nr:para-hydroxybenzoate-polyprenyltransferase [Verticillium alfalfae VaMs.102]EEY17885.1 para-hydroxybenzoate-polyprenyltransferase [Verticillium alfalfae VaMs.102]